MKPPEISGIIFVCMFLGALVGNWLQGVLPDHHLSPENKDLVKLGAGLIGTMAALLLGLLIASAKSSYDVSNTEVTAMAANLVLLDRGLDHYGPEASDIRDLLKTAVAQTVDQLWSKQDAERARGLPAPAMREVFDKLQQLQPHSVAQRALQSDAESVVIDIGKTRLLLLAQNGTSVSAVFLIVVVFWLALLFVSFGLFAPRNTTAIVTLLLAAISVAAAFFLILELECPFSGLIQVSSTPLRNAIAVLGG